MNKIALRTAVATALIAPAVVLGAGAASAQPTVGGTPGPPFDANVKAAPDDIFGMCLVTQPGFQLVVPSATGAPVNVDPAGVPPGTGQNVSGTCFGLPYFVAPLSGPAQ